MNVAITFADTASKLSTSTQSYWTTGKNMPTARGEFGAVLLKDKIYAIGGVDYIPGEGRKAVVEVYDIASDKWSNDVKPLPIRLDHFASAVYNDTIYVVGGFLGKKVPTDRVFIYHPEKDEWHEGKALPSPRGALTAQFINGILYAVGGLNSSQMPVDTNYAFDPKSNMWTEKTPMITARQHMASAVLDGKLYVMGGRILGDGIPSEDILQTLTNYNRTEMYDPNSDTWTTRQPMLTKRTGFTAASSGGHIFVFGGQEVHRISNTVEKYDPILQNWVFDIPMSTERFALSSVSYNGQIFVLGGQTVNGTDLVPSNLNEIFHTEINAKQINK